MDLSKFESVFRITSKYTFHADDNPLNSDLICVICKKMISDAVVNTGCDCRYCYNCISHYTAGKHKYCPGGKEYCNVEPVVLGVNACRSIKLNRRISELQVNCPNHLCMENVELKEMENHLRFCTKKSMECPYVAIGCNSEILPKDELAKHMQSDALPHSQLMIDLIQNMRNEIDVLKNNVAKDSLEIVSLKEELSRVRKEGEIKVNEVTRLLTENIDANKSEIASLKEELLRVRNEYKMGMEEIKGNMKETVAKGIERNKLEVASLKEELERKENRIVALEEELKEVRVNEERNIADARMTREAVAVIGDGLDKMRAEGTKCDEGRERRMNNLVKWNKLCPGIDADYAWRIDGYSGKKRGVRIDGESFYWDNYKLCLSVNIWSDGRVWIECWIMKGDKDDELIWPMKRAVTLGIVNQLSWMTDSSVTRDTAFNKPETDRNEGVGTGYLIITDKQSVIVNNSFFVSCVIRSHL